MRTRLIWVDLIRTVSVFGVIVIHVTSPLLAGWQGMSGGDQFASALFNVAARFCVPVFFMASGFLLLGRDEPARDFFLGRAVRVLIPLVAWSLIYALWFGWLQGWVLVPSYWLKSLIKIVVGVPTYFHLWFLYALVGIYLFVPILRHMVMTIDRRWLWYFAALWFISSPLLLTIQSLTGRSTDYDLGYAGGYFGYFLLGHLLGSLKLNRLHIWLAALGWLVIVALTSYLSLSITASDGGFLGAFVSYLSPQVALMSICAFLVLRALGERVPAWAEKIWTMLGQTSFGIYLAHMLATDLIRETSFLGWSVLAGNPWFTVPAQTLAIGMLSLLIVLLLRRIPGVRRIVPG